MGQSEGTVVELNGTPHNGSRPHLSSAMLDWTRETDLVWLPTTATRPAVAVNAPAADDFDAERSRLEAEIAAAKARAIAARERAAQREAELRAALQAEIAASREELSALEREHDLTVARVRDEANAEVERILAEARRQAAREATASSDPLANAGSNDVA